MCRTAVYVRSVLIKHCRICSHLVLKHDRSKRRKTSHPGSHPMYRSMIGNVKYQQRTRAQRESDDKSASFISLAWPIISKHLIAIVLIRFEACLYGFHRSALILQFYHSCYIAVMGNLAVDDKQVKRAKYSQFFLLRIESLLLYWYIKAFLNLWTIFNSYTTSTAHSSEELGLFRIAVSRNLWK